MGSTTLRVELPPEVLDALRPEPRGSGGFQTFLKELRTRLHGSVLEVDPAVRERIEHYAFDFGGGGWQNVLRRIVERIEAAERVN